MQLSTEMTVQLQNLHKMEDYQTRVFQEKEDLDIKIKGLQNFIESEKFNELSSFERNDMEKQLTHMRVYTSVLQKRINRF